MYCSSRCVNGSGSAIQKCRSVHVFNEWTGVGDSLGAAWPTISSGNISTQSVIIVVKCAHCMTYKGGL